MRFSEAVRLGSLTIKPMAYYRHSSDNAAGCALGMAEAAASCTWAAEDQWTWLSKTINGAPCGCLNYKQKYGNHSDDIYVAGQITSYARAIIHLFNEHVMEKGDWTLDKLCEWIASVEPKPSYEDKNTQQLQMGGREESIGGSTGVHNVHKEMQEMPVALHAEHSS